MGVSEVLGGLFEGKAYATSYEYDVPYNFSPMFYKIQSWQRSCREDLPLSTSMIDEPFAKTLATWPASWLKSFVDDPLPTSVRFKYCITQYHDTDCIIYEDRTIFNDTFRRALFFATHDYSCQDGCCSRLP